MTQGSQGEDNRLHRAEKIDGLRDQAEKSKDRADLKSSKEADNGMEKHSKTIAEQTQEKRKTRKSGVTDKFNENQDGNKKVASADELLPLEDSNNPNRTHKSGGSVEKQKSTQGSLHESTEALKQKRIEINPAGRDVLLDLAAQTIVQTAKHQVDDVISNGNKFLTNMGKGMQETVSDTVNSVASATDYYGKVLTGKTKLESDTQRFGKAIADGTGQALNTASDYYLNKVPNGQNDFGKDISQAGKAASDHWNSLDWEQKGHFIGKEVIPLAVPGAVGMVAKDAEIANLVSKTGDAISNFANADKLASIEQKMSQLQGHIQKLQELAQPLRPTVATAGEASSHAHVPAEAPRHADGFLMKHGDKGLPQGIKPSEKVTLSERFGVEGNVIPEIKVPEEVYKAAEKQGFDRATVDIKLERLGSALARAHQRLGEYDPKIHGTERQYGTALHEQLRQNIGKDSVLHTEESYLKGQPTSWGKLGSSRPDVVLGDKENPFATVCLKTLDAVPSAQQERGWVRNIPQLLDGSTVARLYLKIEKAVKK